MTVMSAPDHDRRRVFCSQRHKADRLRAGRTTQKPLSHSADHIDDRLGLPVPERRRRRPRPVGDGVQTTLHPDSGRRCPRRLVIAYDDIASINYFGDLCKAWYRRDGRQITDAIRCAQEAL